jgi:sugar-specific transcriptional regulator TrmB
MNERNIINKLIEIGINEIESLIYIALLKKPDSTGYEIAKMISKPVANTYKALQQLETKGLVVFSEYDLKKKYSVIDMEEYIGKLEQDLNQKKLSLLKALSEIDNPKKDFGSYIISDLSQMYEKAKKMIKTTQKIVLIDAFPKPYEHIREAAGSIDKSQIKVKLYCEQASEPDEPLAEYDIIMENKKEERLVVWVAQWLVICKDTNESLIAAVSHDGKELLHAVWTTDPFVSLMIYNGLVYEFLLMEIFNESDEIPSFCKANITAIHSRYRRILDYELNAGNELLKIINLDRK